MSNHTSFADLEIRIFPLEERGYPVEITLDGQQEFPRGYLDAAVAAWTPSGDPEEDGRRLFAALFAAADLRAAWAQALGQSPRRRIRLRIDPAAAELHALPWELLHDGTAMLSAQADTPFSRYLPIALPWGGPVDERPVRVLVVVSNPADLEGRYGLPPVEVERERAALQAAFDRVGSGLVRADFLPPPVTLERVEEALRTGYHVLHFIGHGAFNRRRGQAALYLQDEKGNGRRVTDGELAGMLARQGARLRLVFLVACQSATRATTDAFLGLAPKLVRVGVPAVVAMQDTVTMESGRRFGAAFYKSLLTTGAVDEAVNRARSLLLSGGRPDAGVPVLFMRLKSGRLWSAEADVRGTVLGYRNPRVFWTGLLRLIRQRKCTPIIGPRVHGRWLPRPPEVARRWAQMHGYPFANREEAARVAQYLATNQGADFPRYELLDTLVDELTARLPDALRPARRPATLTELVRAVGWQNLAADDPNDVHRVLAALDLPLYLTTNADNFMVEALRARGRNPQREICRWNPDLDRLPSRFDEDDAYEPSPEEPLVYHLFGSDEEPGSLVLSEDDYMHFLVRVVADRDRIPNTIREALSSSSLMFLGYSLYDWEFRVLMNGLIASLEQRLRFKHVTVQLEVDAAQTADTAAVQAFLEKYFQEANVNVFWGTTEQFIAELREYSAALPG